MSLWAACRHGHANMSSVLLAWLRNCPQLDGVALRMRRDVAMGRRAHATRRRHGTACACDATTPRHDAR
eukprot:366457-Chlamydomonas_euryale.AAC.7